MTEFEVVSEGLVEHTVVVESPENMEPEETNDPETSNLSTNDSAVSPSTGSQRYCVEQSDLDSTQSYYDMNMMDEKIKPIEEQLQYLLNKADEFQAHLMYSHDHHQNEGFSRVVPTFLRTCQPYFTYLESTARSSLPHRSRLPLYIRTRLLQFSEQLCIRLERLVLLYASFGFLSLEEANPLSISHFYIGQCQIDSIKVSVFRYCCPAPFLSTTNTGLYKRMRWNVERQRENVYFLCCEDMSEALADLDGNGGRERAMGVDGGTVRMWSIGQWIQTHPDPQTEDIYDWILCWVPEGQYRQLLYLGTEEPSACIATDCLLGELLSMEGGFTVTTAM
ncbi:UPF0575 protein C19orf67 homolog [Chanos chanos]|uniref:UPF0575 protein C19orf67 homolog n=1 Tax=Chanos chanos TaxID=29144 RepID=A0A6J2VSW9_CHACN|nr:UPF0575 protein C19orf67 homolog [Chanos chanos]